MPEKAVFSARGRAYSREHVLSAAEFRGELAPIRNAIRDSLVCSRYAEEEGFEIDPDELQAATEAYRYENDLTTAEDTERWLEEYDLTLDDFSDYFERHHWLQRLSSLLDEMRSEYAPAPEDIIRLTWQEVVLSNHLPRLARALAWRVAAALEGGGETPARSWSEGLMDMEARYVERRSRILTAENYDRELRARPLALMRFGVECACFASPDLAKEAFLCVTQDGEALETTARRAGGQFEPCTHFGDEFPVALQQKILSAAPGETLPPVQEEDGFRIYHLDRKIEPDLNDREVRERIEQVLLNSSFGDLVGKHIVWAHRFRGMP